MMSGSTHGPFDTEAGVQGLSPAGTAAAPYHVVTDAGGTGGGGTTTPSGSTGTDYSTNAMAVPLAGYVLVGTLPVNLLRNTWSVYNFSGAQCQYVFDDGNATAGTVSPCVLAGGSGSPSQGGSDSGTGFFGRIRAYAPSASALVLLRQT